MTFARRAAARIATLGLAAGLLVTMAPAGVAQAADPIAGPQTSGDPLFPNQGNGGYDVSHYDVKLAWTPGATLPLSTIDATVTVDAVTTGNPLSSFSLDFEGPTLTVSSVTVNGVPASFTRVDGTTVEPPAAHKLVVTPVGAVEGPFTTVIRYSGIPTNHVDSDGSFEGWNPTSDGATFLAQPIGAMAGLPVNNTPDDKATYRFALDIPTTITNTAGSGAAAAVSNGELLSRTPNADGTRTTWVWDQRKQMASELILISIGKYDMIESSVTLSDGRTIPEWSFIDSAQSTANKTTFTNRRAQLQTIIQRLENLYGPYPGNSTGVVMDSVPSGISYALETQDRSFFPSVSSVNGNTLIHELAHQWYGDAVSPKVWNDIWINEGMGTWGPSWYTNVLAPATPNPAAVETTYFTSWNNTAATSASWNTPPSRMTATSQLYGYQTYTRGAQFYEALRTAIGTTDFLRFVKEWQVRYHDGNGGALDFENLAEEISGRDLTEFFDAWIWRAGKPAWPFKHDLAITSPAGDVVPGDTVTYTVTATNTGKVAMTPVVAVDLTDVLDDATIDESALPAGTTLEGTTLVWTVPSTPVTAGSNVAQLAIPVTVQEAASSTTLTATARARTLGSTCVACSTSNAVPAQPITPAPEPTTAGTPAVGSELTAVTDGWPEGTTFTYQWLKEGVEIEGATGVIYTPAVTDLDAVLAVEVTGSRAGNLDTTRTSAPTAPVAVGTQTSTPTPTVTGTPKVAVELTGVPGTWDDGVSLAYQWLVAGVAVDGATGPTFTPRPVDAGKVVTFAVTGTRTGYAPVTRTSEPTAAVAAGDQTATPTPTITGTAKVDVPLTGVPGTWDADTTLTYRWLADGVAVAGATATTFTPGPAQAGRRITFEVTGTKAGYAPVTRTSAPTAAVVAGDQVLAPTPTVTGTPTVGVALTGAPGTWDAGTTLAYQWVADGSPVPGATSTTYTPRPAQVGAVLRFVVTSTKAGYTTVTRYSEATAPVASGDLAPTSEPTVTGTPKVGVELTAVPGEWDPAATLSYVWRAGTQQVGTGATYTPGAGTVGQTVTVSVTGTRPGYAPVTETSEPTAAVALGDQVRRPVPSVTGVRRVGTTLTVVPGTWDDGTTLTYHWLRDGAPIAGATRASYALIAADNGRQVRVVVISRKAGYADAFAVSAVGPAVAPGVLTRQPKPAVSGVAKVGRTLTAVPGTHDAGVTLRYQWVVGDTAVAGATGRTFKVTAAHLAKKVMVRVTATKPGYVAVTKNSERTARVTR